MDQITLTIPQAQRDQLRRLADRPGFTPDVPVVVRIGNPAHVRSVETIEPGSPELSRRFELTLVQPSLTAADVVS